MRRGLSVLEMLVGMVILAVAGMAVIGAMRQSAREVDTTSDHTLSLFLSQKEMEEALQAVHENTYVDVAPASWGGPRSAIKDRGHPHFAALEDTDPPFGRIEPGVDVAIEQRDEALFRMFRDFSLSVEAQDGVVPELPGSPKYLFDLSITTDCPGIKDGTSRFFSLPLLVPKPVIAPERPPPVADDPASFDQSIRTGFYPAVSASDLPGVAAQVGGNLTTIREVGGILAVVSVARREMATEEAKIILLTTEIAKGGFGSPEAEADKRSELARAYEKRSAIAWRALLWARDPAGRHSASLTKAAMGGNQSPTGNQMYGLLNELAGYRDVVTNGCAAAQVELYKARQKLSSVPTRPFWQLTLERKILELSKLRALLTNSPDLTFHASFTTYLLSLYRARNRAVEAFLTEEKRRNATLDDVRAQHPVVAARVSSTDVAVQNVVDLRDRVLTQYNL